MEILLLLTAYKNSSSVPYPIVPSPTPCDLPLSHNTSVTDRRTTIMPIARPLVKYGRLNMTKSAQFRPQNVPKLRKIAMPRSRDLVSGITLKPTNWSLFSSPTRLIACTKCTTRKLSIVSRQKSGSERDCRNTTYGSQQGLLRA